MDVHAAIESAEAELRSTAALARDGLSRRGITAGVASGRLIRVRPGWYASGEYWRSVRPELQHIVAIVAAQLATCHTLQFSHRSAATLHGLPVWSEWISAGDSRGPNDPKRVHLLVPPGAGNAQNGIAVRHRRPKGVGSPSVLHGISATSPARTLCDLAASESFLISLACADAQLREAARARRTIDTAAWNGWREELKRTIQGSSIQSGRRAARALGAIAHPGLDSPLESISRLRFLQLGINVEMQVPVRSEHGGTYYLDFLLQGLGFFGESDGKGKYLHDGFRAGKTAEEVIYEEKIRRDWIEGSTGLRGIRWGAAHTITRGRFAVRLRNFGVPVRGSPTLAFGREVAAFLDTTP